MRGNLLALLSVLALAGMGRNAFGQPVAAGSAKETCGEKFEVRQLADELRILRRQISEWRLEALSDKAGEIGLELQAIRADKLKMRDEQQNTARQMSDLDVQIHNAAAGSEQRTQLEAVRTALAGGDSERAKSALDRLERREAELSRALTAVQKRTADLQHRLAELSQGRH
jgi:hypothetical protein